MPNDEEVSLLDFLEGGGLFLDRKSFMSGFDGWSGWDEGGVFSAEIK